MTSARTDPPPVTVRVPAKVNLELRVGPLRPDGYHAVSTVYQAVSLHDDITVVAHPTWSCEVDGPLADGVPVGETNLALRVGRLFEGEVPGSAPAAVTIRKRIPVAGGMAGGSADAAATLVALDRLWQAGWPREDLEELAGEIGCDVPLLIAGGTAIGSGRGELLTPVLTRGTYHWVFALSHEGLPTSWVYAELDRLRAGAPVAAPRPGPELMAALRSGAPGELAQHLHNDLQAAAIALRPQLADVIDSGMEYGALAGIVSGSGPTVAFLVADNESGIDLAVALTASGSVHDVRRASGPVHGAHVIPAPVD